MLHTDERGFISQILKKAKTPNDDWTAHKKLFLDFYDIKGAAKFNFFVLHELKQTPTEKVRDFFTRVEIQCEYIIGSVNPADMETLQ